jgi:DDE superfamily endonuclease
VSNLLFLAAADYESSQEAGTPFRKKLVRDSRRLRQGKIRRGALLHPAQSAFEVLFTSGQEDALVTLLGFDHASFALIHTPFRILFDDYSPYCNKGRTIRRHNKNKGIRRLISSRQCLALVLAWTRTRGSLAVLQLIFGLTAGHLSLWMRFGRRLLLRVLREDRNGAVVMPDVDEIDRFMNAINVKYPALHNCWGAMDGLKLRVERSGDYRIQNMFFNGWQHDHYISNLFLFSPDGKIRACYINAPGTMHDSQMAKWGNVYSKIDELFDETGAKIVVDSAFSSESRQSMFKSWQSNIDNQGYVRQNSQVQKQATAVRQLSEWGMRGLQASFPRLKDRMVWEEKGERRLILEMIVRLYNYRASVVGLNQIQSVFMPSLERSANRYATR